jgi:signal transduction histidine kinase
LFVLVATHPTNEPWNLLGVLALFVAMLVAERMSVPLPNQAAISIASIPHTMAVLLLPTWLAMLLAGSSMLLDQLVARAPRRKVLFNTASVSLTLGVTAIVADRVGLGRGQLEINQWQQVPAFLIVATTYYTLTNGLVAVVISLGAKRPAHGVFVDNARFVLPAEFAVCGIGGLVTIVWVVCPAWTPLVLFPAVVSQVAFMYVTSSKRNQTRLEFVAEASRVLAMSLDRTELSNSVVRLAVPALGDNALVALCDATGTIDFACQATAESQGTVQEVAVDSATWQTGRYAQAVQQVIRDGKTQRVGSGTVVGIRSAQRTLGALVVTTSPDHQRAPGETEVVEELARRYAATLENARLHAEAQHASRLRDDFLSVAAHELKTPVTSLRGYAQLLLRYSNNPDPVMLIRGLNTIELQTAKLSQLTNKLLDVSRIDSGKLRLEPRLVDIAELLRGTVATAQGATELHRLHVSAPETCRGWIDPLRFEQVLANLLSNAVKYSPDGGDIDVSLEQIGGDRIQLRVRDHGLGIPPDRRDRLFDRMYQAHGDGYLSGLGLGLFIARQIVELHGGSIEAGFPTDGGTQITFTLPLNSQSTASPTS